MIAELHKLLLKSDEKETENYKLKWQRQFAGLKKE